MTRSCTSRRYTYSAFSLTESVASNSTALRPSAYATPATKAALNNSASCLNLFIAALQYPHAERSVAIISRRLDGSDWTPSRHSVGTLLRNPAQILPRENHDREEF